MEVQDVIDDLKKKRELSDLDNNFIKYRILNYLKKNELEEKFKEKGFSRTSIYNKLFKEIRKQLHEIYGVFRADKFKEHPSIKERLVYYKEIYYKIFSITGKPKRILDLGCGLNPMSYEYLGCKPYYYASDVSHYDLKQVNQFFKLNKIKGKTFSFNMIDESYKSLPTVNVCFLFKVLESLEYIEKNISERIMKDIKADWIVVSFAKKQIGGAKIRKAGRSWFRKILAKLKLYYVVQDIGDEIFFIIRKK
ncbi:MAG: hypothetical protein PHF86_03800 [Candidatus Nanoarchaeia archaeon]|nr:hypothetical protein [Candidatus Nanoarchaeia archaeon]